MALQPLNSNEYFKTRIFIICVDNTKMYTKVYSSDAVLLKFQVMTNLGCVN